MYFYHLVIVLLSCALLASADTCVSLNATFTVSPRICYPTYSIPSQYANNNTGGNLLASYLNSLSSPLSQSCAQAFAAYYCAYFYPECDAAGNAKSECGTACNNVLSACQNDSLAGKFQSDPYIRLPDMTQCGALTNTNCTTTPVTNLTAYYTNCAAVNITNFHLGPYKYVCTPKYLVPTGNLSYSLGDAIFTSLEAFARNYTVDIPTWMYPCLKAYVMFYCADAFPECPAGGVLPVLPVCQDKCSAVVRTCGDNITSHFSPLLQYHMPIESDCDEFPNNAGVDCFVPIANDTDLTYFFNGDPPPIGPISTSTSTSTTSHASHTGEIVYPPGGAAKGGGIGAAVLVAILGLIGLLMLIMKKQDAR